MITDVLIKYAEERTEVMTKILEALHGEHPPECQGECDVLEAIAMIKQFPIPK